MYWASVVGARLHAWCEGTGGGRLPTIGEAVGEPIISVKTDTAESPQRSVDVDGILGRSLS